MEIVVNKSIQASNVRSILGRHMLADGLPMVLDMDKSDGVNLFDAATGRKYIDFFGFFASNALGMNHPKLVNDEEFKARLMSSALNKVTNSDVYTVHLARFVDTFSRVGIPEYLPYAFFVSGGALAVENALKASFDWKVRKNFQKGYRTERGHQVMHFDQAFHGRTGYTLPLTNTSDPRKTQYFPKFNWPRVLNPMIHFPLTDESLDDLEKREKQSLAQAKMHFHNNPDDIACVIIEPIQGEGGDNHFRPGFLQKLKDLAHENDTLLIFDEVQSGVGITGRFWAHQGIGVEPDIISFGKKTQVCGILAGRKLDEVHGHVFETASRINSTWGGNLVDMVRFDRILEVIEEDNLVANAELSGDHLLNRLKDLEQKHDVISNARGRGLMCAFDLETRDLRDRVRGKCMEKGLIILGCGISALRFRSPLTIKSEEIDEGIDIVESAIIEATG
ncbi:MAG: L-lysine 6-transaminase [Rhodothermales bacterium]|nr:L-lysine 6-transaminase [Rhodothermales bacterium]